MGGGERGAREARGSEDILTWVGGERGARVGWEGARGGREGDKRGQRKFYHGIRPFRVGGGEHPWNQEEENLSWDTTL